MKPRFFGIDPIRRASNVVLPGTLLLVLSLIIASCGDFKTNVVSPPSNGSLNFSVYVSIGNSLTAGYQNGALYESAQKYSYPADIARQAGVPDSAFQQPLMPNPGTGTPMYMTGLSSSDIHTSALTTNYPINVTLARPYNNLGIPGAVLGDMIDTSNFLLKTNAPRNNGFFALILRNPALGANPVAQALALHPTFVSVWIGANDVLGYATSGGTIGTSGPGTGPTDPNLWGVWYDEMMGVLLNGAPNAKFVVADIPYVTAIPFFTTIPPLILGANGQPVVIAGHYVPLWIQGHDSNGNLDTVQADSHDLVLLTATDALGALAGTSRDNPLPDQFVLDTYEISKIIAATDAYNSTIKAFADANPTRVAFLDAKADFNQFAQTGYMAQGIHLSTSYVTGGFFGLDGIHPTSQGYAYTANLFIKAINQTFGSNIPIVAISSVPSSIPLGGVSVTDGRNTLWRNVHYAQLKPMLDELWQGSGR